MLHDLWVSNGCRERFGGRSRQPDQQEQCQRHAHPRRARVQGRAGHLQLSYGALQICSSPCQDWANLSRQELFLWRCIGQG